MSKKKIAVSLILGTSLLVLAGCSSKNGASNSQNTPPAQQPNQPAPGADNSNQNSPSASTNSTVNLNLPKPSGSVDSIVNSVTDEANSEETQATSDENDAKSAVNSDQETNDLSNSYDPNAIK